MDKEIAILIVEDSEDDTLLIVRELQRASYNVDYCRVETAEDMEKALSEKNWDLVLSDYTMPQFNGLEALRLLRARNKDIPFIFLSGTIGEDKAVVAMKSGANDYVVKGNLKRLIPAIERELREAQDRRAHHVAEKKLKETEARFRNAFDNASIGMALISVDGRFLQVNSSLCQLLGYSEEELLATRSSAITHSDDSNEEPILLTELLSSNVPYTQFEKRYRHKQGHPIWTLINASVIHTNSEEMPYFIFQIQDITSRKLAEAQLKHIAHHDPLTGLANRSKLEENIDDALKQANSNDKKVALLFMDLDRFKMVNDTIGHQAGDQFLQAVSARLRSRIRGSDVVARLGGDEFVIILPNLDQMDVVELMAQKLLSALADPFNINEHEFFTTGSIGISIYPTNGQDPHALMKNADLAMYRAKELGGNNYQFCTQEMTTHVKERVEIENLLRHALKEEKFEVHYQPQINLESQAIIGVEALIRLQLNDDRWLPPGEFIPVAEKTNLIMPIGEWVMKQACAQLKLWQKELSKSITLSVAVNFSAPQLSEKNLVEMVAQTLKETGLEPHQLEIEITESAIMRDVEKSIQVINSLKKLGVKIAVDDFGTGYSSLTYLKHFNVDKLKIDQSFIRNIPTDQNDAAIVTAIIAMAHSLGMKVIAEGVENKEQLTFLMNHSCDEMQGFYFSAALPVNKLRKLLHDGKNIK